MGRSSGAGLRDEGVLDVPEQIHYTDGLKTDGGEFVPLYAMIEQTERVHIHRALNRADGSVSETADLLGISRKTLWEKMRRLEISNPTKEARSVDAA